MADGSDIVVLGAGVLGLTTALVLAQKYPDACITVVAKHMPGDYDIEYASPWAGPNFMPVGEPGSLLQRFEKITSPIFFKLASETPEAGIHFQDAIIYNRSKDADSATGGWFRELVKEDSWLKDNVKNYRTVPKSELKPGTDSAIKFTSVCINTAIYLPWLAGQCLKHGIVLKRGIVHHILAAPHLHRGERKADLIINCAGLSAGKLGGVNDPKVYPTRGQILPVRQEPVPMVNLSGTDDSPEETAYAMSRAAGDGTVLGGCSQENSWESQPDLNLANHIMKRAVDLIPELTGGEEPEALEVVKHGVVLRPMRRGGPRLEKEKIGDVMVVHSYGYARYGYNASWGAAHEAVKLVKECLKSRARL